MNIYERVVKTRDKGYQWNAAVARCLEAGL